MTDHKLKSIKRKLQESGYRLITGAPELAFPLVTMIFVAAKDVFHMSTNGSCIYFDASWLDKLSDRSLDYALAHQLMHLKLNHLERSRLYKGDRFHYACNIVVNSHLVRYGFIEDRLPGIGELRRETLFPKVPGSSVSPMEAYKMTPFDPSTLSASQLARIRIDSDFWWDSPEDLGENGIIVLSPDDPVPDDLIPSAKVSGEIEYYLKKWKPRKLPPVPDKKEQSEDDDILEDFDIDYITRPTPNVKQLVQDIRSLKSADEENRKGDNMTERVVREVRIIPKDWRAILNHFIMDETRDYDFTPPDRRMQDLDFFLPDFNQSSTPRLNVLFMVDISGSLRNEEVSMALSELNAAIDQFGGMLQGTIGFFDTIVRRVSPIRRTTDLWTMVPGHGGGTDFNCIFNHVKEKMAMDPPSEIVIMTDGKSDFPDYSETMGIPVLWLLTNNRVRIPWGQAAYFRKAR